MRSRARLLFVAVLALLAGLLVATPADAVADPAATVFINEIHYDNAGTDAGESIEVAGVAGTDLTGWTLVRYNGSNGTPYGTEALSGTLADESGGFGFAVVDYPSNGLQNGAPDGVALVDDAGTVVHFISYEGSVVATAGPASGLTGTDIGVAESSGTPLGSSLQLTGSGASLGDFTWAAEGPNTFGAANTGQTFDGGPSGPADPVINELGISDAGADNEFVEIYGDPTTDYSAYTLLSIEGEGTATGTIDRAIAMGTTDAGGLFAIDPSLSFENGGNSFLLVDGFTGAVGDDVDTDDDGTIDNAPWTSIVDGVAIDDGGAGDLHYATPVLDESFDDARLDNGFAPGGLSRIPDGADTDTAADWYRNDFDWDGITNGSPVPGEALNTPGAPNEIVPVPTPTVFISEIHYDNEGADVGEFVEVEGDAGTDLSGWTLVPYNGSNGTQYSVTALSGTIDNEAGGQGALSFAIVGLQNGSPDGVALVDDGGTVVDFVSYEGSLTATDGPAAGMTSTDVGVSESGSTLAGESLQLIDGVWTGPADDSPGDLNGAGGPGPELKLISEIQGAGDASPLDGQQVVISGIVVGDFQEIVTDDPSDEPLGGFFVQEEDADADADPSTSEGIFVFAPGGAAVALGDLVEVTGTVDEFFGLTELTFVSDITVVSSGNPLPTPATPTVPTSLADTPIDWEAIEGMSVSFSQPLYVSNTFPMGAFGEVGLSAIGPWDHPNQVAPVGSQAAADVRQLNLNSKVLLDDGEDENESFPNGIPTWNPTPTPYLGGPDGTLRAGDRVDGLSGVVHYAWSEFEVHPVNPADATDPDGAVAITRFPRPASVPDVGGDLTVATFNVLNYFVTLDQGGNQCGPPGNEQGCRGADTQAEFDVQAAKIADAIADLDADIVGLIELENSGNDEAIADLVAKVNAISARTYAYVPTGFIGTDAIAVGYIYDPATVALDGGFAVLDSSVSPAFIDTKSRPALAQTFTDLGSGENLTIAVNHLKSKGSACDDVANPGDPAFGVAPYALGDDVDVNTIGDPLFTGNCNLTRTAAAQVLGQWLAQDPTGAGSDNLLVLGDLNAYATEDPITELEGQGYTDLKKAFNGGDTSWAAGGHSFVFNGELGTLDYGMANAALAAQVTGAEAWHINADEPFAIDYQNFNPPGQSTLDEWKSSDHDPLLIGLSLAPSLPTCDGLTATIIGTEDGERINGTSGDDVIVALGGNDRIFGRGGNDVICAGDGNDRVYAGGGDDTVFGEGGNDFASGGSGEDTLDGGDGDDRLYGDNNDDILRGGGGDDLLVGGRGVDDLDGGADDDTLYGSQNDDVMAGGDGDDRLFGNAGNDELDGGEGVDLLHGGGGNADVCTNGENLQACEL